MIPDDPADSSDELLARLNDPSQDRGDAALRLGQRKERAAVATLIGLLENFHNLYDVGYYAAEALGDIGDNQAVPPLIAALDHPLLEGQAAEALEKLHDARALEPLIALFKKTRRSSLATLLGNWGDARAVELLIEAMEDPDGHVRYYAARALGKLGDAQALPVLERAKADDTTEITDSKSLRGKTVSRAAAKAIEAIKAFQNHAL